MCDYVTPCWRNPCYDRAVLAQVGDCSGELSLLGNRPLWYTLVVHSAAARMLSLDTETIRTFLASLLMRAPPSSRPPPSPSASPDAPAAGGEDDEVGPALVQSVLGEVSQVDTRLYSSAVQQQAMALQVGPHV